MKKTKSTVAKKFFVVGSVMLWLIIIVFSLYVLKTGGHLKPKAAGIESVGFVMSGRVISSEIGVGGAKIIAVKDGTNNYSYTDSEGNYTFGSLSGTFKLRVEKEGYKSTEVELVAQNGKFKNIILTK